MHRVGREGIIAPLLAFCPNSKMAKALVQREARGTGTTSISKGKIQKALVPMLPDIDQDKFTSEVRKMYEAHRLGRTETVKSIFTSLEKKMKKLVLKSKPAGSSIDVA